MIILRAVGYCRYSTDNQTENSIAYQISEIQKFCESHHLSLVNIYIDEALSGTNTNRQGLKKLLDDVKAKAFDAVIIYDQSRLSRNILDWFSVRETLRRYDISLFSCTEQLDNGESSGAGFLSEGVRALFNHQMVLDTRAKTISGQTTKAKQGAFLGGTPPLGYDIIDGKYVINPAEAEGVHIIFDLYSKGKGYGYIIDELARRGIKSKRGGKIAKNALYAILRNKRYIGIYSWNNKQIKYIRKWAGGKPNPNKVVIPEGIIPPIIDKELWTTVQNKIKSNAHNPASAAKNEYLLSGLIRCGMCGGAFHGVTTTSGKGYKTRYYACGNHRSKHDCDCKNINADELEVLVCALVEQDILNETIIEDFADLILASYKETGKDRGKLKQAISDCDMRVTNLLKAVEKGLNPEAAFERIDTIRAEKVALQEQLDKIGSGAPSRQSILAVLKKDVEALKADRAANIKPMLHKYITGIIVTNDSLTINTVADKKITTPDESGVVNKNGCGGRI